MRANDTAIPGIDISAQVLRDRAAYIQAVRQGVSGDLAKQAVDVLGHREAFGQLLGISTGRLKPLCSLASLTPAQSEPLQHMLRLVWHAQSAFGDLARATEWFDSALPALGGLRPIELCDTFEGRQLVLDAVRKIEQGEFP